MRPFKARYRSKCPRCGRLLHVGQMAIKAFDINAIVHWNCMRPPQPVDQLLDAGLASGFTVAVTGSRAYPKESREAVRRWMDGVRADAFVTGGGVGLDEVVGSHLLMSRRAEVVHLAFVPDDPDEVSDWWSRHGGQVQLLPGGTAAERNEYMAMLADHLVAFVSTADDEDSRSLNADAWDTVGHAREMGVPVTLLDLDDHHRWGHTSHPAYRYRRPAAPAPPLERPVEAEGVEDKEYF